MAGVTRAEATAQVRRTISAYQDRVHEVRNDTDCLPPEGARIVDEYCSFDNDWQDLVQDAVREASFLGGMDDRLLLEYCAVCKELDGALGLGSWHIGRVDRIIGVADLSYSEKIKKAIEYSDILGEILEEVGDVNALVAQMAVVSGVLIALAATGYGAAAEVLGLALLVVGASFSGTDLLAGIAGLVKFFTMVDDAKSEDDLKACGKLFGDAVARIGVNGLFFVLSLFGLKKTSARLTARTVADSNPSSGKWKRKSFKEKWLSFEKNKIKDINSIFKDGVIKIGDLKNNPDVFNGKTVGEIAQALKNEGYDITITTSTRSRSGAQIIKINNMGNGRNISQVQVSPGGGRHGSSPYVKISTNDQGIIKIVNGSENLYVTDGNETATVIFTGGK